MKIIVRTSDNVVVYALNDQILQITETMTVCNNIIIGDMGISNSSIYDVELPENFKVGAFLYVNGSFLANPNYVEPVSLPIFDVVPA